MSRAQRYGPRESALQWTSLLLALVVLSIGLVVVTAGPAEAEQFATLHPLTGTVEVARDGEAFREGRQGQVLRSGDTVRTGPDGRAEIEYFDESVTRLDFDTTFTLRELASDPDIPGSKTILTGQRSGRTFERIVALTESKSRFEVATPTATASVQGTTFDIHENPDGTLSLWVLPDDDPEQAEVVLVLPNGAEVSVLEMWGVIAFPDGTVGEPFPLTDEHLLDPWILFNQCELDDESLAACQEGDEPDDPEGSNDPNEGQPAPAPSAPASFSPTSAGTTASDGGGGDGNGGSGTEDTTPPRTTITHAPPLFSNSRDATFRFRADEPVQGFFCSLDGGSYSKCVSGRTYTGLGEGTHVFHVRAVDIAGNQENTASHRWSIDITPPNVVIDGHDCQVPGDLLGEPPFCFQDDVMIEFSAGEVPLTFACQLQGPSGSGQEPCAPPGHTYSNLTDGSYTFTVVATDRAGNSGSASLEFIICASVLCVESVDRTDRSRGVDPASGTPDGSVDATPPAEGSDGSVQEAVDGTIGIIEDTVDEVSDPIEDLPLPEPPPLPLPDCSGLTNLECLELKASLPSPGG